MITVCLFGISAGLEVHPFSVGEPSGVKIDDAWLEISPHDVTVKLDVDLFKIYRRIAGGKLLTWIGLYRSATELGSSRPGGYYGAGVWLHDVALPGQSIAAILVNLADQLKVLALSNGKFVKRIADVKASIIPPQQLSSLTAQRGSLGGGVSVNGMIQGFIADPNSVAAIFDWAQKSRTAELFSQIVVGSTDQYVQQQGQFQKSSEKYDSLHAAIDGAYAKRITIVEDARKKVATDLEAIKKETAQLKQSKEIDQKKLQEADQKVSALTTRVENLQRVPRPLAPRVTPQPKFQPQHEPEEQEARSTSSVWLYAVVIVMSLSILGLALVLYISDSDARQVKRKNDDLRAELRDLRTDLGAIRNDNVKQLARIEELKTELNKAKQRDTAAAPAEELSDSQVLSALQDACIRTKPESLFVKFRLSLTPLTKSTSQLKGPPDTKMIYKEVKAACKIEERNCLAAFDKFEDLFVKRWDSTHSWGNIFLPESCEKVSLTPLKKPPPYELKLSRPVAEALPLKTSSAQNDAAVAQDPKPSE